MNKFVDSIKAALAKKQAANHPDTKLEETKSKLTKPDLLVANKPQKKVTGRGR